MHVNIIYHKKKQQSALKITGASIIIIINNEVIHIYTLSYTCEVSFFLIHNEQTIKTLTMDCFLSSHYHRETRSHKWHAAMRDYYLLSEVYNIAYHGAWWYSELRLNRTPPMIYTDSSAFPAIYPLHCPIDSRLWPQTFTQCFCQLRADLEIFWLEIRWSKTTIRTSPLKSTGPGSWGADKRSIQAFWILLSKQASPRFEAIRKLFSWHGMDNNNLLFWIIPSSHNSMCEKSIH